MKKNSIGNIVENRCGEKYLLAQVGPLKVCAINIQEGNYWTNAVKVKDPTDLTPKELDKILLNFPHP
jgi:hypothetical protein